ncbi:MAG: hypothetical protein Q4E24_12345 [bacterium]|nr:hypothetical protein [bacterium]
MNKVELGSIVAEYPPVLEKKNPRNSEGAFLTLRDGTILFVYSKFKGESQADFAPSDICLVSSKDGGKSFGEEKIVLNCEDEQAVNIMSLSLLKMENGDIGLVLPGALHIYAVADVYAALVGWWADIPGESAVHPAGRIFRSQQ